MASKKKAHPAVPVIFGVFFILVGCFPGVSALQALVFAQATRGWSETTAIVTDLELSRSSGSKKSSSREVQATYRYLAPDVTSPEAGSEREYTGKRVGIHGGSDNIGNWQQATFQRLDQAQQQVRSVPCWYNPADPTQAVLDRDPRWPMMGFLLAFPLVFGLFGGAFAWIGVYEWRKRGQLVANPRAFASATVITAEGGGTVMLWVITCIWNVIAWGATLTVQQGVEVPLAVRLGVLIFPVVGLLLLFLSVLDTVRVCRFGRPRLRLEQAAWLSGRRVQATVVMATAPGPEARLDARLLVVRRIVTGSGEDRKSSDHTLWSCDLVVDPLAARQVGTAWEQSIELPLPSDLPTGEEDLTWSLEYQAIRPGPDLSATFKLPVAAGDDGAVLYASEQKRTADRAAALAVLSRAGLRIAEDRGAVVISLPGWRNPWLYGPAFVATVLLSLFALMVVERVAWWTALGSLPLLLVCWRGVLRSALWRSALTLSAERIVIEAGWWRLQRHELVPATISEIERHTSMNSGDIAYYNLWLKTTDGARIAIARGVPGAAETRLSEMINAFRAR